MRKAVTVLAYCLVIVGGVLGLLWVVVIPNYRPSLQPGELYGIDVSHHQGEIDWSRVANDNIDFAYMKATEGGDWVDPRFVENWQGAVDNGLSVGAYHFFRTCTDGQLQANNILATVPEGGLPIAIDVEGGGICGGDEITKEDVRRELNELVELVEAERGPVIFYVLEGFDDLDDVFDQRDRWQRGIGPRPAEDDWFVWQQSNQARIDGIDGKVDLNVGRLDVLVFEF